MEWPLFFIGISATFVGTLAGSGGMINMPLMMLYGLPIHTIISSNKFANTLSSFSSFLVLLKKRDVHFNEVLYTIPFTLSGGIAGAYFTSRINEGTMTLIALFLLVFALVLNFIKKPKALGERESKLKKRIYPLVFGIGAYDGMFGPGQGTLLMYTFLHNGFSYIKSVAFTRFQTFISCSGAFTMYAIAGMMDWSIAISLAAGSIIGAQMAVRVAKRMSMKHASMIIRFITVLLILQLFYNLIF
ncbi:sulfite exporter TauE/SafE family protein [Metabacillus idriensis]|uniref:sulfite exporter TauE/SafE family protein n=1 Tax=Metabacillus idriensis TaxID=324768 RepID=UPI0017496BF3|nr:sulfite exporter TauE/SafE family protein [Metabacillus idriensis]